MIEKELYWNKAVMTDAIKADNHNHIGNFLPILIIVSHSRGIL